SFERYSVNVIVSREAEEAAPMLVENNPTLHNLVGDIEHLSQIGALITNFTLIKPGALHKANGGYLVIDIRKLLMEPFAWEALKRVLRAKEIRIESPAQQYSLISTVTLEPEPIPLEIKIVLVGERLLYYLLYEYDPDFRELFKVAADFEEEMERSDANTMLYTQVIATMAGKDGLKPLSAEAVGRVIEQSSRYAEDNGRLSMHLGSLSDLLKEADYLVNAEQRTRIEKADIEKALERKEYRMSRPRDRLYERIADGTLMINVTGSAAGQVNGLSMIELGGYSFGIPSRITARTRIGKGQIIDIAREVKLGGPIHSKGVMILSAYLGSKYAGKTPLSLSASLVFEQTYGYVEGDSASGAELFALLSSLADLPILQTLAVTGSVNQFGELQAVGGINEKIEGFFDVCSRLDPDGEHGVIIPAANVRHLMLTSEVREAVEKGTFSVYAVHTVDEGMEILTGVPAGERDGKGNYPDDSINGRIVKQLAAYAEAIKTFVAGHSEAHGDSKT
ncbi:MAG: Lon protease family protein, partial [Campylobacterales bacterium]